MFKSLKKRGEKVKERVDFKFGFHATKVPSSGWDKLVVCVIPLETGRVSYKTTRASVRNGNCQWPDAVIESVKLSQDSKTKEYDEKLYKFIISTGSSRTGVLGEITIDVAEYTASNNPSQIALPLRNCNAGTILHTSITCLTPRTNSSRDVERNHSDRNEIALEEDDALSATDEEDLEDSDLSGNLTAGSVASNTSTPAPNSTPTKVSQGTNGSQNRSQRDGLGGPRKYSNEGLDPSTPRLGSQNGSARSLVSDLSPSSSMNSASGRQDRERDRDRGAQKTLSSQDSNNSATSLPPTYVRGLSTATSNGPSAGVKGARQDSYGRSTERGEWTSQRSRIPQENGFRSGTQTDLGGKEALKAELAAAGTTIEDLRIETVTVQRQNRKLNVEIETLKQQLNAHMRQEAENGLEMTTLVTERDRLRQELEQVRSSKIALEERESGEGSARSKVEDAQRAIQELQEEIRYQKEQNMNLNMQLRKTQDSNMELVLAIRDLEESLDQHRKEVEELTILNNELEEQVGSKQQDSPGHLDEGWKVRVSGLEEEKKMLEAQIVSLESAQFMAKTDDEHVQKLERMIEQLTRDVEELEKESKELADENMELYTNLEGIKRELQLKNTRISLLELEVKKSSEKSLDAGALPKDLPELSNLKSLVKELESKLSASEDAHKSQLIRNKGHVEEIQSLVEELRTGNAHLERQLKIAEGDGRTATAEFEMVKQELINFQNQREDFEKEKDLEIKLAKEDTETVMAELEAVKLKLFNVQKQTEDLGKQKDLESKILKEDAQAVAEELERLKAELASLHNGQEDFEYQKEYLETQLKEERAVLESSLAEAIEAFAAQEQELRTIEESATRAEEERSIALDKIVGLEDDISRLKKETQSIVEAKGRGESLVAQLQLQKEEFEESKIHTEIECLRLSEQVHARETEVAQLFQQIASHVDRSRELESRVSELEREKAGLESSIQDCLEGDRLSKSRIEELEFQLSVLSEEMDSVNFSKREFEEHALQLEGEKRELEGDRKQLEIRLKSIEEESKISKNQVVLLESELTTLRAQMENQTSFRSNLERRTSELESSKDELYNQLTDMEEENRKHTERIAGLEAQLRFVTEERETHKLERGILETRSVDHRAEKTKFEAALQMTAKEHQQTVSSMEGKLQELIKQKELLVSYQQEVEMHVEKLEHEAIVNMDSLKVMKDRIHELEKTSVGLEMTLQETAEKYFVASKTVASLETEMLALRADNEDKTSKLLLDLETMRQFNGENEQRAKHVEETLRRTRWEKAAAVERLQMQVQLLTEQMTSTNDEKEKLASEALVEASELRAEKGEWEERMQQSEEKVKEAHEECSSLRIEYGSRLQDLVSQNEALKSREQEMTFKLSETLREFGDLKVKEVASRNRAEDADKNLALVSSEKEGLEDEVEELRMRVQDAEMLSVEIQRIQSTLRQVKIERDNLDDTAKNTKVLNEYLEQEKNRLEEDITAWEKENEELKHIKIVLEERIVRLQSELETQGAARSLEAEQRSESVKLRHQNSEFKRKLTEYEEEKEEFKRKVQMLEGELKVRSETLGVVEKKLKDKDYDENGRPVNNGGSPSFVQRSLSRSSSRINSPSRESKELNELREKVKFLEGEVESNMIALSSLKRDFSVKESILYKKIELLEGANEQLVQGGPDLGMDQLQMELTRLQNLNAVLGRRERELLSQLSTQEVLHKEVQRLQEENEQLENRFVRFKDTAKFGNLMERVVVLETELAEALEANSMYKMQLRNAFAKQQNVQAAALHEYGDVDQLIGDLVRLKKHSTKLEEDVKDLRERYTTMSLRYAEVSAQTEELTMKLRNLRNGKKS